MWWAVDYEQEDLGRAPAWALVFQLLPRSFLVLVGSLQVFSKLGEDGGEFQREDVLSGWTLPDGLQRIEILECHGFGVHSSHALEDKP